jgi:hypothetical protein
MALTMAAAGPTKTSVSLYQITRRDIPESFVFILSALRKGTLQAEESLAYLIKFIYRSKKCYEIRLKRK